MHLRSTESDEARCPACGYRLTGLPRALWYQCPECGGTTSRSRAAERARRLRPLRSVGAVLAFALFLLPAAWVLSLLCFGVLQRVLYPGPSLFARIDARDSAYFFNVTMVPTLLFVSLAVVITVLATWWAARGVPQVRSRTVAALAAVLVAAALAMALVLYGLLSMVAWFD